MFDWLFDGLAGLLSFFFDLTGSIGFAIILLTIAVMLITSPLTMKGTRSMMKMQRYAPEMKKLQQKYKDDREKLNQEMLAFYQEHGINPLSGCLPLLIQMPVFFVLFQLLRGLGNTEDGQAAPKYIEHGSELFHKIERAGGELISWGFDLADAATSSHESFVAALPYYVLIALVGFTAWFQQRQAMGRRDPNSPMTPQQQMMQRVMVIFLPLISLSIPAGVVIYFFFSNAFRIGQQWFIHHLETREKEREKAGPTNPQESGGLFGRLLAGAGPQAGPTDGGGSSPDAGQEEGEATERPSSTSKPHPRSKKKKRKKKKRR